MKNLLNLKGVKTLNRMEQKSIFGGLVQNDGCRIAVRNEDGTFAYWSASIYSYSEASSAYANGTVYSNGSYASGYCCASCAGIQ